MTAFDPARALAEVVRKDESRIVRLWSKRLLVEFHERQFPSRELRPQLEELVAELARLLEQRGDDVTILWPEAVRSHGLLRYEQRFEADELAREFKALHEVLLRVYVRRRGEVEPEVAELLAELIGEAVASVETSFARAVRTEEIRFREAGMMETVLHHVDLGILLTDADGRIAFANPPSGRILGLPIRLMVGAQSPKQLGQLLEQIDARRPDGKPFRVPDLPHRRVLLERVPVRGVWMEVRRPGGGRASLEMSATPLWEEGDRQTLVGVIQTITDRSVLVQTSRALSGASQEVERLQAELGSATRARALVQLATATSHSLSNALNALHLRLKLMRGEVDAEHLNELDGTVGRLGELVKRLQEFTVQPDQAQVTNCPLVPVVQQALEVVGPRLRGGKHPLRVQLDLGDAEGLRVRADADMLRELFYGFALTARERMAEGGTLEFSVRPRGEMAEVVLTDSGGALTEDDLEALFEPFASGHPVESGTSLILAEGRQRAAAWGGSLTAESTGEGLLLSLALPLAAAAEVREPGPEGLSPGARLLPLHHRVLVVDDDPDNARMLAEVLGDEGYDVRVASGAREALRLFDERQFDAALLDAVMPGVSGWELAEQLRERKPDLLIAMVTGMDVRGQSRESLALVDAVFRKPVDMGALDDFLTRAERNAPDAEGPSVH